MLQLLINIIGGINRRDALIAGIIFLSIIYVILLFSFPRIFFICVIISGLSYLLFLYEKKRSSESIDFFEDDNLFFRHGILYRYSRIPMRFSKKVTHKDRKQAVVEMGNFLVESMKEEIDHEIPYGTHKTDFIEIYDRNRSSDKRKFIRFLFRAQRGGEVNHFVFFQYVGDYVIVHLSSYVKGISHWYDITMFLMTSPLRIWFWMIPWLRQGFSIVSRVSRHLDNSFEEFDILAYLRASRYTLLDALKHYLDKEGLLSEELKQIINYQMIFNTNIGGNQIAMTGNNNTIVGSTFNQG